MEVLPLENDVVSLDLKSAFTVSIAAVVILNFHFH